MSNEIDLTPLSVDIEADEEGNIVLTSEGTGNEFKLTDSGVWVKKPKAEFIRVCDYLRAVAYVRPADGGEWRLRVQFRDRDKVLQTMAIALSDLAQGRKVEALLSGAGLHISKFTSGAGNGVIQEYLNIPRGNLERVSAAMRGGWLDDRFCGFVFKKKTVRAAGSEDIELLDESRAANLELKGSLEDWQREVCGRARHSKRWAFGLCVAVAAPLLEVIGKPSVIFHFQGDKGSGKSKLLKGAASVYGNPEEWVNPWNSTDNGVEGVAARYNGLPLLLDELGVGTRTAVKNAPYLVSMNKGRTRKDRSGRLKENDIWHTFGLSAGEIGLEEARVQLGLGGGIAGGEEARFLSIPIDAGAGLRGLDSLPDGYIDNFVSRGEASKRFADSYDDAAAAYHGEAGKKFIECLMADIQAKGREGFTRSFLSEVEAFSRTFEPDIKSDLERRVLEPFAIVAAAGQLACDYGVFSGWSDGYAKEAAAACFYAWKTSEESPEAREDRIVERILELPDIRPKGFLVFSTSGQDITVGYPERHVLGSVINKANKDNQYVRLATVYHVSDFSSVCSEEKLGRSVREVIDLLEKRGLLCSDGEIKRRGQIKIRKARYGFSNNARAYIVLSDRNVLEEVYRLIRIDK